MNNNITQISELDSVHGVKVSLCFLLDKLARSVYETELHAIAEDSGVISYFYLADAIEELIENDSITAENITGENGQHDRKLSLSSKGKLGAEYFNTALPRIYRRKLLETALRYYSKTDIEKACRCIIDEVANGYNVDFALYSDDIELVQLSFYAPTIEMAELIAENIKSNPQALYENILGYVIANKEKQIDVENLL